jgi:peptidoglycan-N-acetylglucosamine deacetylase
MRRERDWWETSSGGGGWVGRILDSRSPRAAVAALLLAFSLAAFSLFVLDAEPAQAQLRGGSYATTTAELNLRSGPGTGYDVKLAVPCGARPYIISGPANGDWYRARYAGTLGYIYGGYATQGAATAYRCTGAYATTTATLKLRSGPGTGYTYSRVLPIGSQVRLNSGPYNGGWYGATYRGATGYVWGGPLTQGEAVSVRKLDTSRKVVALTFDAGSDVGYAKQILDTLKANNVKASFGMKGEWAEEHPILLRRMVAEGHTLVNHTYSHPSFTGYSTGTAPIGYSARASELAGAEAAVQRIAGVSTKPYFRPPYGDYDQSVLVDVYTPGYRHNVMWSVDSLGWQGLTKQQILQRCVNGLEPGAIYLFHVGSDSQDGPALQSIINSLRDRGYGFTTVGDFYRR